MENKQPTGAPQQGAAESQDILSKAKKNSKTIAGIGIAAAVVLVGIFAWFFIAKSGSAKADEAAGRADVASNDSTALVLYKEAAEMGYKSGNRAKAEVAIRLYKQGKYQEALDYLKDTDLDDNIAAAGVYSLEGDCYVNLKDNEKALKAFDKAISKADKNPSIVPIILIKKANVYRAEKNYKEEAEAYKAILDDYPQFTQTTQTDVKKLYERAKASAE